MMAALISPSGGALPAQACPTGANATSPAPVQNGGFPAVLQVVATQQAAPEAPSHEVTAEDAPVPGEPLPDETQHTTDGDAPAERPILDAAVLLLTGVMLCPLQGRVPSPGDEIVAGGSPDRPEGADTGSIECSGREERSGSAITAQVVTAAGRLVNSVSDVKPGSGNETLTSEGMDPVSGAPRRVIETQLGDPVPLAEGNEGSVPEESAASALTSWAPHATSTVAAAPSEVPEMVAARRGESEASVAETAAAVPPVAMAVEPSTLRGRRGAPLPPAPKADATREAPNAEMISGVGHANDGREFGANVLARMPLGDALRHAMRDFSAPNGAFEQRQAAGAPVDDAIGAVPVQWPSPSPPPHRETSADAEDRRDAPHAHWQDPPAGIERVGATGSAGEPPVPAAAKAAGPSRESISQMGMERVLNAARASTTHGGMEVRLRLHPEALGEVSVQIRWEGGVLSARLETATQAARDALENGAHALRTALQEQGIPVERLSVGIRLDLEARSHPQDPRPAPERGPAPELLPSGPGAFAAEATREPASAGRLDIRI